MNGMRPRGRSIKGEGCDVASRQRRVPISVDRYRTLLHRLLILTGRAPALVGLTFVSDRQMRRLNRVHRQVDRSTDVLAFPVVSGHPIRSQPPVLGDIVISIQTAKRQAPGDSARDLSRECVRLLIHGYLHLLGYDHERSPREARRMQRMARRLERLLT